MVVEIVGMEDLVDARASVRASESMGSMGSSRSSLGSSFFFGGGVLGGRVGGERVGGRGSC